MVSESVKRMYESHNVPVKGSKIKEAFDNLKQSALVKLKEQQLENARRNKIYQDAYKKALDKELVKKANSDAKRKDKWLDW